MRSCAAFGQGRFRLWREDGPELWSRNTRIPFFICFSIVRLRWVVSLSILLTKSGYLGIAVLEAVLTLAYRVFHNSMFVAMEYHHLDTTTAILVIPDLWNSLTASVTIRKAIYIFWEPPFLSFIKVKFDGSIRGISGGVGFVICDAEYRLLAIRGIFLYEPSISELRVA